MEEGIHIYFDRDFVETNRTRPYSRRNNVYRRWRDNNYFLYNYSEALNDQNIEKLTKERKQIKLEYKVVINKFYGKLSAIIFRNLSRNNIINLNICVSTVNLYQMLYTLFSKFLFKEKYSKTNENKISITEKIKLFVKSLPSIKFLEKFMKKINLKNEMNINNTCSIYIVIELLYLYYELNDFPLFENQLKVVNLAIDFYSNLTDSVIDLINEKVLIINNYFTKKYQINTLNTKEEILNKYKVYKLDKERLFGNLHIDKFTN